MEGLKVNNYFTKYDYLKAIKTVYIYGAGSCGSTVYEKLRNVCGKYLKILFIDRNINKVKNTNTLFPTEVYKRRNDGSYLVIVALENEIERMKVINSFRIRGYMEGINLFQFQNFMVFYDKLLALKALGRCCIDIISIPLNFKCNLKCKKCIGAFPILTNRRMEDRPIKEVLKDAEILFDKIDFIQEFDGGGGEVFLYQQLPEFLIEIQKNYKNKIGEHSLLSNGTVVPSDELCKVIKENDIKIRISYYSMLPDWEQKYLRVKKQFNKWEIQPEEIKNDFWLDYGFSKNVQIKGKMLEKFEGCSMRCSVFYEGKEYICYPGLLNGLAYGFFDEEDGLDFYNEKLSKENIFAFNNGICKNGAPSYCAFCKGASIYSSKIPVAEQL